MVGIDQGVVREVGGPVVCRVGRLAASIFKH
jgi:hypothetical protein